jgi:hypothetical protein
MKTSELQGAALDWAVAKCEGWVDKLGSVEVQVMMHCDDFKYSTNWAQGGPIIERGKIQLSAGAVGIWGAFIEHSTKDFLYHGPTPLIAAMRCYVTSKLGDEVEIPEELK